MSDISEANIRSIVRSEMNAVADSIKREISRLDSKLSEIHSVQGDVHRSLYSVERVMSQTSSIPNLSKSLHDINVNLESIRLRVKHAEDLSQYTAGYVAMRLKERYDKSY